MQWSIANGDTETGVTSMLMNACVDAGDILLQRRVAITATDTGGSLSHRLAAHGASVLMETLDALRSGDFPRHIQDPACATSAPKLRKSDGNIDWTRSARDIHNQIRGFDPWPGTYCEAPAGSAHRLRVTQSRIEARDGTIPGEGMPGRVIDVSGKGPLVATGDGSLRLIEVQPAGKRRMTGAAFLHGHPLVCGDYLG